MSFLFSEPLNYFWYEPLKSNYPEEYEFILHALISARRDAQMTQSELAARLQKPQSFVSKYERGERRLDVVEFVHICRVVQIDPSSLIRSMDKIVSDL